MDDSHDICPICHESMNNELYILPECAHVFHTNCILHWFRSGQNTCPLCMNKGINGTSDLNYGNERAALENYKKMRRQSRGKNAPKELIKAIARIKQLEKKHKTLIANLKKYKNKVPVGKTNREIHTEWLYQTRKAWPWRLRAELKQAKIVLGSKNIIPLIIATKINIT